MEPTPPPPNPEHRSSWREVRGSFVRLCLALRPLLHAYLLIHARLAIGLPRFNLISAHYRHPLAMTVIQCFVSYSVFLHLTPIPAVDPQASIANQVVMALDLVGHMLYAQLPTGVLLIVHYLKRFPNHLLATMVAVITMFDVAMALTGVLAPIAGLPPSNPYGWDRMVMIVLYWVMILFLWRRAPEEVRDPRYGLKDKA